jgi:hypothetical protein
MNTIGTITERFVVQLDRLGGQVGNQKWYWGDADFRVSHATLDGAVEDKLAQEKRLAERPSKFVRGVRIVKRVSVVTETVVEEAAVA